MSFPTLTLTRSERRILGLLFRTGGATQNHISEILDLAQQSISRLITGLLDAGLARNADKIVAGRRGYPSALIKLVPDFCFSFGISIAPNALNVTLVDFAGAVRAERSRFFDSLPVGRTLDWIGAAMAELSDETAGRPIAGLGISLSGSFTGDGPGFNTPRALEEWANIDVGERFSRHFGLPAWADNDGNAAALGESLIGVGRWARSFAYLYLGYGVGGGVVLDGEVWRGRWGNAGEFAGGLPGTIYPFPNLELLRHLLARDGHVFETVEAMADQLDPAWPAVDDWIARVRDSLSIMVSNATAILDLDAVVLGGRMPRSLAARVIPAIEIFDQKRRGQSRPSAKIVPAEAEGNAAAIGAAMLPLKHRFFA